MAFDNYCKIIGYEKALPLIKEWLNSDCANVRRAVSEGLRICQLPPLGSLREHSYTVYPAVARPAELPSPTVGISSALERSAKLRFGQEGGTLLRR